MPTELDLGRLAALVGGVAVIVAILAGAPVSIPGGWDKAAHFAVFSLLTVLLWQRKNVCAESSPRSRGAT